MSAAAGSSDDESGRRQIGLWLGPVLAAAVAWVPWPIDAPVDVRRMAAVTVWMAVWWVSEAIPLGATSLLPLVLFPLLGLASASQAAAPYANHLIYLFLGGFFLAQAMQRWNLHRRIALHVVLRVGTGPSRIVLGFMIATAFLSMWVSNTATAAMMMPIGMAVIDQFAEAVRAERPDVDVRAGHFHFGAALMLGIAYAASIGGIGTLIGTPPNVLLAGTLEENFGVRVGFAEWLAFGVPFVAVFLPLVWLFLTRVAFPPELDELPGGATVIAKRLVALGPMKAAERRTAVLFTATAAAWIFRPLWTRALSHGELITDSTIAIASAVLLFALPAGSGDRLLDWAWAVKLPWDVLLLFGGGFALASGFERSGLSAFVGNAVVSLRDAPLPLFVVVVVAAIIVLTEFASNTASAAMALPILGAAAAAMGASPTVLCVPAAMAASCAFMLPAATPPNAILFGTGCFTIPQMVRVGAWINLIAVALIALFAWFWLPIVF